MAEPFIAIERGGASACRARAQFRGDVSLKTVSVVAARLVLSTAVALVAVGVGMGLSGLRQAQQLSAGAPGTPAPTSTRPDPKLQPRPSHVAVPTEAPRWSARTAAEVSANIVTDAFVNEVLAGSARVAFGPPAFARALLDSDPDVWLIPLTAEGRTAATFVATVRPDGTANAGIHTYWEGPFPHTLSTAEAAARGSVPEDPVVQVELVWAFVHPRHGDYGTTHRPFYRLVRASGTEAYVFQNGNLVLAKDVPIGD